VARSLGPIFTMAAHKLEQRGGAPSSFRAASEQLLSKRGGPFDGFGAGGVAQMGHTRGQTSAEWAPLIVACRICACAQLTCSPSTWAKLKWAHTERDWLGAASSASQQS